MTVMTTHAATSFIDAGRTAQYHACAFLAVRNVSSADRIAELDAGMLRRDQGTHLIDADPHYAEFRGRLQNRCAEYGKTSTFCR